MIDYPNCKINLGLRIAGKRDDGYHNIETIFYPVNLCDMLEILKAENNSFQTSGLQIDGNVEDNICVKALNLLSQKHHIPGVKVHLHKTIPTGAGLGGGSSDGAYTLKILNKMFSLNLSYETLKHYAGILGSDCSFFLKNKAVYAYEKGDKFEDIEIKLKNHYIIIVKPDIHVNTKKAYSDMGFKNYELRLNNSKSIKETIKLPINEWRNTLVNDFEEVIFKQHPTLLTIKENLYKMGAAYASMTGSGAAIYGIFKKDTDETIFKDYGFVWKGKLL
jgi:4-diphosphocytidyl-2-C-methyl-D-erythritol kinase